MTRKMYAITYDDGNNYYGDIELMTESEDEIVQFILKHASNGSTQERYSGSSGLDGVWLQGDQSNIAEEGEPGIDAVADTEVVFVGANPQHELSKQELGERYSGAWDGTWTFLRYKGPRDDMDRLINWLDEFTDQKFTIAAKEIAE